MSNLNLDLTPNLGPNPTSPTSQDLGLSDGVIVVSYYLPVQVSKQETSSNGRGAAQWHVEWDHENLMSLKTQLRVTRIGK